MSANAPSNSSGIGLPLTNRAPTAQKRQTIQTLIKRDEEVTSQLRRDLENIEQQILHHQNVVHNYRQTIDIATPPEATQRMILAMNDVRGGLNIDSGEVHQGRGGDRSQTVYRDFRHELELMRDHASSKLQEGVKTLRHLNDRIRGIQEDIDGHVSVLAMLDLSKKNARHALRSKILELATKRSIISAIRLVPLEI
ncbi:SubName: Full=Uncharacterized protein {ECO:0000313/EMBL:CCA70763.1} [Serendipita indica DSM 11827]|nr:SubName: Full=Uncharacterized protein {ECO:0000313/EMBL:CCA70763.1} [Serendipita indica DSM 11827]